MYTATVVKPIDTLAILNALPCSLLILLPDAPHFTIVGVTDCYMHDTHLQRHQAVGKSLFETLIDNPNNSKATVIENLSASLQYVLTHKTLHRMADQRYDIWNSGQERFEQRTFRPLNKPVLNTAGDIQYIIHSVEDVTEKIQLEERSKQDREALERSLQSTEERQKQLLALFEQSPVAIAVTIKENLTLQMVNPFYAYLVNRTQEELVGRPFLEALPELAGQGFDTLMAKVIETGEPFLAPEVVAYIRKGEGLETIFVNLAYQPMREGDGSISGVFVIATDVTFQVQARQRVAESEARFRSIIEEAPVATCLFTGPEMKIEVANLMMIDVWGKGPSVLGMHLCEALPELEDQPFLPLLGKLYQTGENYEAKGGRADLIIEGEMQTFYFDYSYKPLRNAAGDIYGILNMAIDVTEQVIARQQVKEAEAKLVAAIELAQLATWHIDLTTKQTSFSPRLQEWLGIEESTLQMDDEPSVGQADRELITKAFQEMMKQSGQGSFDETYTIVNVKTGQNRIIHAIGRTLVGASGHLESVSGTAQDVTMQKQLQLALEHEVRIRTEELAAAVQQLKDTNHELEEINIQLKRSNEELSQYAYVASHDLQEPLRKIRTFTSLAQKDKTISPGVAANMQKIDSSAERMRMLINDLLSYSQAIVPDSLNNPVDLSKVAADIAHDLELLIQEKQGAIRIEGLPVIEAANLQMNQLFSNLIGNALKFSKPGVPPVVEITAVAVELDDVRQHITKPVSFAQYYRITFSDNGIGFNTQYREQVFEVFKRLHNRYAYPGSGIGLALCKRIVSNHNGGIYVESVEGEGSAFHVLLPARQQQG